MPSVTALRLVVGTTLGLGGLDLALIDLVLAPALAGEPTVIVATAVPPVVDPPRPPPVVPPSAAPVAEPRVERVYFETDSTQLTPTTRVALAKLAVGDRDIVVSGHADIRGTEALNRSLSKQRAEAVAAELIALGISRDRIRIAYRGAEDASTTGPLWRDRRVDIEIGGRR
jgi:outer membrane protein OmpA-like peptidoglycan-associated protein